MGFFDKFKISKVKEGLSKTRESLFGKIHKILTGKTKIDDETIDKIEEILIGGDVGVNTTMKIIEDIRSRVKADGYENAEDLERLLRDEVKKSLDGINGNDSNPFEIPQHQGPHVIMIVGVNGVGKTTTIGKLAYNYRTAGKNVLIAAADTFRAAANEQLEIWAKRAGVEIIQQNQGADPGAVAYDGFKSAISQKADLLLIDTAGRLHTKINLMEELKKVKRVLQKLDPAAPHEIYLVVDASTGQNAIQQVKQFSAAVGVTGLILTKLDGTAKGGVIIAIHDELKIPVRYIGVGEKIDDLQPFDKKIFVDALFDI